MNEPARGPNRPMASGRRPSVSRLGRRPEADTETNLERVQPRIPWSRRVGIVVAMLALGGTVVLAGGFGGGGTPSPSGSPSSPARSATPRASEVAKGPTPTKAPILAGPATSVTSRKTVTLRVTLTASGIGRKDLQLRIYRNDQAVRDVPIPKSAGPTMPVRNIPLKSGVNAVSAVYLAPGGEGPRSNVLSLTVDDVAPRITLAQPKDHAIINAPSVTLTGRTDAGARVAATNLTKPHTAATTADETGQFSMAIALEPGGNDLTVTARDEAGNVGRLELTVTRGTGSLDAQLTLSKATFRTRQLPATFDVTLLVIDANGLPVDGAPVTFSLSPPGQPTSTYAATTESGRASWNGVTLPEGLQPGRGFVTARVTLPDGSTIQRSAPFVVR